jgi:hypothetical protein
MPKRQAGSELLKEGCRSYHKALFAVMQFRREVQQAIRSAVDERIDDLTATLQLDKAKVSEGLTPYADPANVGQSWDGSDASVGLKYPARDYEARWGIYFYFWIGDSEETSVNALCWLKEPGLAIQKLAAVGMETDDCSGWISEPVGQAPNGFSDAVDRVLNRWIEAWRKVGGIQQFLLSPKINQAQAGE